jgi:hypothetical protein
MRTLDKGYGFVYRKTLRKNGKMKNQKIELYATGDFGSQIRDANTGAFFNERVGSSAEQKFFKVGLSTGELKCKNGSTTLFFITPEEYEKTLHTTVSQDIKNEWLDRKNAYLASLKKSSSKK